MNDCEDTNKDFAKELIERYGEDRFYHSCSRTKSEEKVFWGNLAKRTLSVYLYLNTNTDKETCDNFFRSLGLKDCVWPTFIDKIPISIKSFPKIEPRKEMCRIAYGLSFYFKEFGLKTYKLPMHIHARMILGEKNEWVESYLKIIEYRKN
jgi:hypothetical protein